MAASEWHEWQVPPFSYYISKEDQIKCREAKAQINNLVVRMLMPVAAHPDLVLDSLIRYKGKMVKPQLTDSASL